MKNTRITIFCTLVLSALNSIQAMERTPLTIHSAKKNLLSYNIKNQTNHPVFYQNHPYLTASITAISIGLACYGIYKLLSNDNKPWQTKDGIKKIANGLKKTLENDTKGYITEDQIKELREESKKEGSYTTIQPLYKTLIRYATIPANADLYLIADLHGDFGPLDALLKKLEKEKLFNKKSWKLDKKIYIGLLGDYIDRGPDSFKNLYYIWKLKEANSDQVFLTRGNHETLSTAQLYKEYENNPKEVNSTFIDAFSLLPVVTFIDRNNKENERIALVHGGVNKKETEAILQKEKKFSITDTGAYEYLWSDMANDNKTTEDRINNQRGAGHVLCKATVNKWMENNNVKTIFHGHDQVEKFNEKNERFFADGKWCGIGSRWNDLAIVLNVAPNTGDYNKKDQHGNYAFYCDYGVIARITKKQKNFVTKKIVDKKYANNGVAQTITTLPEYILEPIYFDPFTHDIVDQILKNHPQHENGNNKKQ